jgi:hypothetical protein
MLGDCVAHSMRVLVGCETSGIVRRAFAARDHDVWSCDLLPAEDGSNRHIVGDVRDLLGDGWDLLAVMHPPCTRLCNSGVRWLNVPPPGKTADQMQDELREGAALFSALVFGTSQLDGRRANHSRSRGRRFGGCGGRGFAGSANHCRQDGRALFLSDAHLNAAKQLE